MSSQLDEILQALHTQQISVEDACRAVAAAVKHDPAGTRMWSMIVDSRVTQQKISAAVGRSLVDAMEAYEPEKTMWLSPAGLPQSSAIARLGMQSVGTTPTHGNVIQAPLSKSKSKTASQTSTPAEAVPRFENTDQLRAFLWDGPKRSSVDFNVLDAAPQVPPPRPLPGVTPAIPAPELGSIVKGRYRLDAHLGYGGIGQIFRATDLQARGRHNQEVTLKLVAVDLKREPQALGALQSAVERIKSLRHRNIVVTYRLEHDDNRVFIVMEPLNGQWLGDRIRQVRKVGMPQAAAWPIVEGIAEGLAYAHAQDIVHSDLSPYAIFVTDAGVPKIMGFGLIHAVPTTNEAMDLLDTMTLRAYSEAYTADTWATHATPHPSDDLYPLGVIAYELLSGKHPFSRHSLTTARQKNLSYEPVPELTRSAQKLIARCLSFERVERPKSARRVAKSLHGPAWLRWLAPAVGVKSSSK
jgi:hypothetical protein